MFANLMLYGAVIGMIYILFYQRALLARYSVSETRPLTLFRKVLVTSFGVILMAIAIGCFVFKAVNLESFAVFSLVFLIGVSIVVSVFSKYVEPEVLIEPVAPVRYYDEDDDGVAQASDANWLHERTRLFPRGYCISLWD